jgi:hypothetical protein
MKKFLITYHAPASLQKAVKKLSKEQQAEGMKVWMEWFNRCGSNLVDMGQPLANGKTFRQKGPVTNSTKNATGYSIIQAKSLNDAKAMVKNHPHTMWSKQATIEVHEMLPIQGM